MPTSRRSGYVAGDVVVVPFPYSDRFAEKRRPALIVSNQATIGSGFVWLTMITSAKNAPLPHDIPIGASKGAGLPAPSRVRPLKIACVEPSRIVRRAGSLDRETAARVFGVVRSFIGTGADDLRDDE